MQFWGNHFVLLWRGTRDGFTAHDFHTRCDGHANTIVIVLDTSGNIFGGFTPLAWESDEEGKYKVDNQLASFLFTLKNPHNFPAKKFGLKPEEKTRAIYCDSSCGPSFGDDIGVSDNCHKQFSYTGTFGRTYENDTRLIGKTFFSGPGNFTVKEIEVYEVTT